MSTAENPSPRSTGFANASLILAIASLLGGPFTAIPAIVCGHKAMSRMRKNPAIEGFGRALAGTILGYAWIGVFSFAVLMFAAYLMLQVPAPAA